MKKKIKLVVIIASVLAVLCIALVVARKIIALKNQNATTYTVRKERYKNEINIAGTVSAANEQTLQALGNGTVVGVYVKKGDTLKKGDLIMQLDDTTEQYNLEKLDYDIATTRITGSQREYELMQKQRVSLLQKISDRKVVATFDGVIADLDVAVGDSLEAKDKVGTLVDISYLTAEVEIAETDVTKLRVNQTVEFTFPAHDDTVIGYVTGWPAIGTVTSRGATVVNATLRIDNYPESILPNFSFTGKIKIADDQELLIVERYAIAREGGNAFVELAKTGERIAVQAKQYSGDYMQITEGLSGGEVLKAQSTPRQSGPRGGGGQGRVPRTGGGMLPGGR